MTDDFKPGKPEVLDHVEIDFDHKDTDKKYPVGRPRGVPNKKTGTTKIFKEQMSNHFEKVMAKDFKYILKNTVEKALDGDMSATKMLMDRVIPVGKAVDLNDNKGTPAISINIGSLLKDKDDKIVSSQ
jgi:hypothetical protein